MNFLWTIDSGLWTFTIFASKLNSNKLAKSINLKGDLNDQQVSCFGILSIETILKLSWALNKNLNIQLSQSPGITENDKEFSIFQYEDENNSFKISLIKNKIENFYFLPELKNIDYLFILSGEFKILHVLKNTTEISSVLVLDFYSLKSKSKLSHFV